jgi:hypothetical protein
LYHSEKSSDRVGSFKSAMRDHPHFAGPHVQPAFFPVILPPESAPACPDLKRSKIQEKEA